MSRGLGRIERAILWEISSFEAVGGVIQHITRAMVADAVFADREWSSLERPTRAQLNSMNRGFRSLIRRGLVEEIDWPNAVRTTVLGQEALDRYG